MDPDKQWRADTAWYLRGATLRWAAWTGNAERDHDHCSCCWAKFAGWDAPEILHEGYTTTDQHEHGAGYHWVCRKCFDDLSVEMQWQVAPPKRG